MIIEKKNVGRSDHAVFDGLLILKNCWSLVKFSSNVHTQFLQRIFLPNPDQSLGDKSLFVLSVDDLLCDGGKIQFSRKAKLAKLFIFLLKHRVICLSLKKRPFHDIQSHFLSFYGNVHFSFHLPNIPQNLVFEFDSGT